MIKLKKTVENKTLWKSFEEIERWAKAHEYKVISKRKNKLVVIGEDDDERMMILEYTNGK